jgi:hypothetical protein
MSNNPLSPIVSHGITKKLGKDIVMKGWPRMAAHRSWWNFSRHFP